MRRSSSCRSLVAVVSLLVIALASATPGWAADVESEAAAAHVESEIDWEHVGASTLDVVLLRPLGAISTIGGFVFFVFAAPFVAPADNLETAWDIFVYGSYDYTVDRPLGEL